MKLVAIAAMMLVASVTSAAAGEAGFTAIQLRTNCGGEEVRSVEVPEAYRLGICVGYTMAVTDRLVGERLSCPPEGVTYAQISRVVAKYIADHPEQHHLQAYAMTHNAIVGAFPCPK